MALLTVNGSKSNSAPHLNNMRPSSTFYVPYPRNGEHDFARSQSESANEGDDFAPKPHPRAKRARNEPVLVVNGQGRRKKKVIPEIPEKSGNRREMQ